METNVKAVELKELWRRCKEDGDERARERLVVAYSPLVKYVAGRMASGLPSHVEEGDLISYGLLGPDRRDRALRPRARDQVRDLRRLPDQGRDHRRAALARLGAALGARPGPRRREGPPEAREQAAARAPPRRRWPTKLGIELEDFRSDAARDRQLVRSLALDDLWTVADPEGGGQVSLLDTIRDPDAVDPEEASDTVELKDRLADAIESLPERERLVIALYYYENLTLREIGEVLGVTESRVSQLHTKAVLRLDRAHQPRAAPEPSDSIALFGSIHLKQLRREAPDEALRDRVDSRLKARHRKM